MQDGAEWINARTEPTILPRLTNLSIICGSAITLIYESLFSSFELPALSMLQLSEKNLHSNVPQDLSNAAPCLLGIPYLKFLSHSSATLQNLKVTGVTMSEATLISSLTLIPNLRNLSLTQVEQSRPSISSVILQSLTGTTLVPALRNVELRGSPLDLKPLFKEMVQSR